MTRKLSAVTLVVLAFGCASAQRESTPGRPAIRIEQSSPIFFGSGYTAPLSLNITVANVDKEPIRLRRVRIQPGAMTQYSFYPGERTVSQVIAPGTATEVNLSLTAYTNIGRLQPSEPLSVRVQLEYQKGETRHQELYIILAIQE